MGPNQSTYSNYKRSLDFFDNFQDRDIMINRGQIRKKKAGEMWNFFMIYSSREVVFGHAGALLKSTRISSYSITMAHPISVLSYILWLTWPSTSYINLVLIILFVYSHINVFDVKFSCFMSHYSYSNILTPTIQSPFFIRFDTYAIRSVTWDCSSLQHT